MKSNEKAETALTSMMANSSLTDAPIESQLLAKHLEEFDKSGISREIAASGFKSVERCGKLLNRNDEPGEAWVTIAVDPKTGTVIEKQVSAKPDIQKGKWKYLTATGSKADAICLRMPDNDYWLKVLTDVDQPIFITEGVKKAASLLTLGYAAIALNGATCYQDKENKRPLPTILKFLKPGRKIILVTDADWRTNETVAKSIGAHIRRLLAYQVQTETLDWDISRGKGIDDIIVAEGKEVVEMLRATAMTVEEVSLFLKTFESEYRFNDQMESLEQAVLRVINKQHPKTYFRYRSQWLVKEDGNQLSVVKDEFIMSMIDSILQNLFKFTNKGEKQQNFATYPNLERCYKKLKVACSTASQFVAHPNLLYFTGCIFNADTQEVRNYNEDDLSLVKLPYSYNPNAECPSEIYSFWVEKYADSRFTAEEQKEQLQALIRFFLDCSKDSHWEHFISITGAQGSGKGVFGQMIMALYESKNISHIDNISALSTDDKAFNYLAGDKRLCYGADIKPFIADQQGLYKLAANEDINIRRLYENVEQGEKFYTRMLFCSTSPLSIKADGNEGLGRRLIVLKTNGTSGKPTTDNGKKINFKSLAGEYASWALQMPRARMEEVLLKLKNANADEATLNYNPIALFVTECFERVNDKDRRHSTTKSVTQKDMYDYYSAWANYSKAPGYGRNKFFEKLKETLTVLYREVKVSRVDGKLTKLPNRFIGLQPVFELLQTKFEPPLLNPSALLEGQELNDLLQEIDTREAPTYEQQEIKPVDYAPSTTPPEDLAF